MPHVCPIISFAAFTLWLLAVVMDGPLVVSLGMPEATSFFLPPHVISLVIIGYFCPVGVFNRLSPAFCGLTALLTMALPLAGGSAGPYLLVLLGISGAFVAITACLSLRKSTAPLAHAAFGLIAANLLLIPFTAWATGDFWQIALIAVPLAAIPVIDRRLPEPPPSPDAARQWHYLPFILVFQIVSGLMYSFIMPAYQAAAYLDGAELPFYMLAVLAALWVVRKNLDLTMVCGVVFGMTAFTLLQNQAMPLMINLSMFAMQAGAGFIDIALLALLLGFPNPKKAFGIGLGTVGLGILTGKFITSSFANITEPIVLTGHLILNLSILTLYFLGRFHYGHAPLPGMPPEGLLPETPAGSPVTVEPHPAGNLEECLPRMPDNIRLLLSDREHRVLSATLSGKSFRETAGELAISESTVKTYMRRIYEKMEVKGKKELFDMLNKL